MTKMGKIIRNGIEYSGAGSSSNIEYLTQEEYDALPESKLSDDIEYRITDANTSSAKARNIAYDNSDSGIEAVNVQSAIDKVSENVLAFPNYSNPVEVFPITTGAELSYKVVEDGYYLISISDTGSAITMAVTVYIDDTAVDGVLMSAPYISSTSMFPIKAGSTIRMTGRATSRLKITKF